MTNDAILNPAFERDLLAKCLRDQSFCSLCCEAIQDNLIFSLPHNNYIYYQIYRRWKQGRLLSRKVFGDILKKDRKIDDRKAIIYFKEFKSLQAKTVRDADYTFRNIKAHFDFLKVKTAIDELREDLIDKGEDFYSKLDGFKEKISVINDVVSNKAIDYKSEWANRQIDRYHKRERNRRSIIDDDDFIIPTGILQLDRYLYGGLEATKAASVLTQPHVGKSIWLINMAYAALQNSFNVIFFTFEDTHKLVSTRLDSRFLGVPFDRIKSYALSRQEHLAANAIMENLQNMNNTIRIIEADQSVTISDMIQTTHSIEEQLKLKFHLVVADYLDIVGYKGSQREERHKQRIIYQDFKNWMQDENRAGWGATQAKVSAKKDVVTKEDVSEAYDKAKILDVIVGLGETTELRENNQMTGFLAKWREGESQHKIPLVADKGRALILDYDGAGD